MNAKQCKKIEIGFQEKNFFQGKEFFPIIYHSNNRSKNDIEDNNEKKSLIRNTVSHKIDLTTNGLQKNHPPA